MAVQGSPHRRSGGTRKPASTAPKAVARMRKTAAHKSPASRAKRPARGHPTKSDALALLKADHEHVDGMFRRYGKMKAGDARKHALLQSILAEVQVHAQIEEELLYPALRSTLEKDNELELMAEADTEHATVKWLMTVIRDAGPDPLTLDAHVKVMGEYIRHHVEEEEGPMFRAARRTDLDFAELGRQMAQRKRELKGERGAPAPRGSEADRRSTRPAAP